jgi:hypothetical protein
MVRPLVGREPFVSEVWASVRFGGDQVEYGSRDVFFKEGGWRGGMGVEETAVSVWGGDVGEVSDFTSSCDFAGWVSKQVLVAVGSYYRLFCSWCLSDSDFSRNSYFMGRWRSPMAQTGSIEDVYFSVASLVWLVANEDKHGYSRHSFSRSCPLRDKLWLRWVCPTIVPLFGH